ncbi:MAG: EAL domain-containing protein [Desulfuromonadaceae bacterium]
MKSSIRHRSTRLSTYKKVQFAMALAVLVLLLCGTLFISYEREHLLQESMAYSFKTEQSLLATLLTEPLLRSDYVQIRNTLSGFFARNSAYEKLVLYAPNDFEIFRATRPKTQRVYQWEAETEIGGPEGKPHVLELKKSAADSTLMWAHNSWIVGVFIFVFVAAFGRLLWMVVRSIGLDPMRGEMERQQRSYQSIFNNCPDGIVVRDGEGNVLLANEPLLHMLDCSADELNASPTQLMCDNEACKNFESVLTGDSKVFECEQRTSTGRKVPVEIHSACITFAGQKAILSAVRDITKRREKEWHLRQLSLVVENNTEGMVVTDMEGTILAVNRAFSAISGYSEAEVLGKNPRILQSGLHDSDFYRHMWDELLEHGVWQGEIWNRSKVGKVYPEWLTIRRLEDEQGLSRRYVAIFTDLSTQKAQEERLLSMAQTDLLTGLPNQMLFRDRLQQALLHMENERSEYRGFLAVMSIGLDNFKKVNDSLGHGAGDRVVVETSKRLLDCVQESDTLSRLRGDEFALLLPDVVDKHSLRQVATKLLSAIREPLHVDEVDLFMTGSIGIALYPQNTREHTKLLQQADTAMHQAKERGRDRYCFFSAEFSTESSADLKLEAQLHKALANNELLLYYQPQVEIATGAIVGAEALLRWHSAELGWVGPDRMIPVAEESGLIVPIGTWVMEQAADLIQRYHAEHQCWLYIAVNVSAAQFMEDDFVEIVADIVERYKIPGSSLELELTESLMLQDVEQAITRMNELRTIGVGLALDDFGTGYTSLAYLKRFPVDKIKLDRAFVTDIHKNRTDAALAQSLVAFTRVMGSHLVAEGIEHRVQAGYLQQMGYKYAQGYLYAKPQPEEDFLALLDAQADAQ